MIAASWASLGEFASPSEVSALRAAVLHPTGGGGGGGGSGGSGSSSGTGTASDSDRDVEIGKITARSKRLARELTNLKTHSKLNLDVSPAEGQLDRWLVRYV